MKFYSILLISLISCGGKQNDDKGLDNPQENNPDVETVDSTSGATEKSDVPAATSSMLPLLNCSKEEENNRTGCNMLEDEVITFNESITQYEVIYYFSAQCDQSFVFALQDMESGALFQLTQSSNPAQELKTFGRGPYKAVSLYPKNLDTHILPKSCQLIISKINPVGH